MSSLMALDKRLVATCSSRRPSFAPPRDEDHTTTLTGAAFDAVRNFLRWTASGQSTLQRKKSLCYDAFALTDHCHPRGTLKLRAAAPAIKINYQGGRRLWV